MKRVAIIIIVLITAGFLIWWFGFREKGMIVPDASDYSAQGEVVSVNASRNEFKIKLPKLNRDGQISGYDEKTALYDSETQFFELDTKVLPFETLPASKDNLVSAKEVIIYSHEKIPALNKFTVYKVDIIAK